MRFALLILLGFVTGIQGGAAALADDYSADELIYLRQKIERKRVAQNEESDRMARDLRLAEAEALIAQGPISPERHVIGSVLSILPGFGVGQAVQGRYFGKGLLFSAGELVGITMAVSGNRSTGFGFGPGAVSSIGLLTFATFKVWEILDALISPIHHNDRLQELEKRVATRWSLMPVGPSLPLGVPGPGTTAGATFSLWL